MRTRRIALIAMLMLVLTVSGCNKEIVTSEFEPTATLTPTITNPISEEVEDTPVLPDYSQDALTKLANSLTEEVLQGEFDQVHSYLTKELQAAYSTEVLKQAFEDTIKPLGAFIEVDSIVGQETEDTIFMGVTLRYENNGLLITYGFNNSIQLTTFYLSYKEMGDDKAPSDLYTEVEITVGDINEPLDGLLTMPKGVEKPPVIILVHGSGQNDMDETIGAVSNKPFRDLARGLAKKGIATIRYNKRYYQYADNIPEDMTVSDEVLEDVTAAIELAKTHKDLDGNRIYVLGHSLGGMLSPKIAQDNQEVAGIISLAGSPRNLEDIIYDQASYFLQFDQESSEDEKKLYLESIQVNVEQVKNLTDENLTEPILGLTGYYWKSLSEIDTRSIVRNLEIPMLFLQGSADFQVFSQIDFAMWKELLEGHENVSFIEYDGLNHLFMPTNGATDPSDYDVKSSVSAQVINDIAEWVQNQ